MFPLIYCNGDSYSDELYHQSLANSVHANIISKKLAGFTINKSIAGCCNRRIIRTSMHDLIEQRKLNPEQTIIAIISLTFDLRSELWHDTIKNLLPEESNFRTHTFANQTDWKSKLLANQPIGSFNEYAFDEKFYKLASESRAYFFSPYAERINLLCDLIMFKSVLDQLNVKFLIFQGTRLDKLENEYLVDFFKDQLKTDRRIFNEETFSFCHWANKNNFIPLDFKDQPEIGHYGPDAHKAFAEQILMPRLQETNQI